MINGYRLAVPCVLAAWLGVLGVLAGPKDAPRSEPRTFGGLQTPAAVATVNAPIELSPVVIGASEARPRKMAAPRVRTRHCETHALVYQHVHSTGDEVRIAGEGNVQICEVR